MKACIAIDDASFSSTHREESLGIQQQLVIQCGDIWTFVEHDPLFFKDAPKADVYVVDFGGLGVGYGSNSSAERCCHQLVQAIEDNPGRLYIIWSAWTMRWYKDMLRDILVAAMPLDADVDDVKVELPANVIVYDYSSSWDEIRAWMGVTKPEPGSNSAKVDELDELLLAEMNNNPLNAEIVTAGEEALKEAEENFDNEDDDTEEQENPWKEPEEDSDDDDTEVEEEGAVVCAPKDNLDDSRKDEDIIGYIKVPVRLAWAPGQKSGRMNFKFADCMVEVTNDDGVKIAQFGGAFFGYYEASFNEVEYKGSSFSYMLHPRDLFDQLQVVHDEFFQKHQEKVKNGNETA